MSEKSIRKSERKAGSASASSPMDVDLLAQMVQLMAAHDLNTLDVRDGARRVILKRGSAIAPPPAVAAPVTSGRAPDAPRHSGASIATDESNYHRITSPMVGTFYASPKPGEEPFVSVGSSVTEESDVCIIEAMKTFNNIKAECRGQIARILVQDGQPVEFGTALFLVKPD